MIKYLIIIIVLSFFGCTSQKKQFDSKINRTLNEVEILIEKSKINDDLIFNILNKSSDGTIILHQNQLYIERMVDNHWAKIKRLNCPCGAPCAHQPEFIEIPAGTKTSFNWDKKESWCGKKNEYGIPETVKSNGQPGVYRVRFTYSMAQNKQEIIYQEFKIY